MADALVTSLALPMGALGCPSAARDFVRLTNDKHRRVVRYGDDHESQFIDVFFPSTEQPGVVRGTVFFVHGGAWGSGKPWFYRLLALPFLELGLAVAIVGYRLYPVCGVPGSDNHNDNDNHNGNGNNDDENNRGGVLTMVDDLESALAKLSKEYPEWCDKNFEDRFVSDDDDNNNNNNNADTTNAQTRTGSGRKHSHHLPHVGTILVGHSSGAHISLLWMVERAQKKIAEELNNNNNKEQEHRQPMASSSSSSTIDAFVGISGVYNIDHHFHYESGRSVEELSPLKPVNGYDRSSFLKHSPPWKIQHELLRTRNEMQDHSNADSNADSKINTNTNTNTNERLRTRTAALFPERLLLIHGAEDDTVPFPSTGEAARILKHSLGGGSSSTTNNNNDDCGNLCIDEVYLPNTGHQDTVVDLMMLGGRKGPVTNTVVDWLLNGNRHLHEREQKRRQKRATTSMRSKL